MSGYGGYWDDTANMTVALMEDGVCITKNFDDYGHYEREEKNSFVRTEDKGYFHTDTKNLYEMLSKMYALIADTEPVGNWSLIGLNFNAWISFMPDGSFDYVFKVEAEPIIVLSGAWGVDADGNVQVLAERFGNATMPLEYTFRCESKQNEMLIESIDDCCILPYEGENVFSAEKPDAALAAGDNQTAIQLGTGGISNPTQINANDGNPEHYYYAPNSYVY
ncbi:MAG: hypothetical protein GX144_10185 [Clostridiaceae bacterium]|nr:hypothetical protein [Clostridiaceae bacterium]